MSDSPPIPIIPAPQASSRSTLWGTSFQGLLWTNWLTAINDNIFRWFVIGVGKRHFEVESHSTIVMWGAVLFVLPYLLFASPAGWLADRFEKRQVIIGCKFLEIAVMSLGTLAAWIGSFELLLVSVFLMGAQSALFAPAKIGTIPELLDEDKISTGNGIFNLATLTAVVIGTAVGALIADVTVGGTENLYIAGATLIGVAIVGTALSFFVRSLPAANVTARFPVSIVGETVRDIVKLVRMGALFRVALGIIFFWTVAGLAQINIDAFSDESGAVMESERTPLLLSLTLGVGIGSVLAGVASAGRIELGLVPWGAAGIAAFSFLLMFTPEYFFVGSSWWPLVTACGLLAGLGVSAGFFDVPLSSYLQKKSPIQHRGAILSATNCLAFSGIMVLSFVFGTIFRSGTQPGDWADLPTVYRVVSAESIDVDPSWLSKVQQQLADDDSTTVKPIRFPSSMDEQSRRQSISQLVWDDFQRLRKSGEEQLSVSKYRYLFPDREDHRQAKLVVRTASPQPLFSARQIFFLIGLMTLPVVVYAAWNLPQRMTRMAFYWLMHFLYRIRVRGLENIPEQGPAILVCNHGSWLDGVLLMTMNPRMPRVVAWSGNFQIGLMKWWARFSKIILIGSGPKSIRQGLADARSALENGDLIAIFPEGGITQTGQLRSFRPGTMKIIESIPGVPVIPCIIDETWGSFFSYVHGKSMNRCPRLRRPISMHIGQPMINPKSTFEIWQAVQRLSAESVNYRIGKFVSAPQQLVRNCKKRKFQFKIGDSTGQTEKGGTLLTKALVLRRLLRRHVLSAQEQNIGVLIPPSNGGVIVNLALALDQRVAINLNYSLSNDLINNCIQQAGIKHVLTSRKVMEKFDFHLDAEMIFLEDFKEKVSLADKTFSALQSYLVPANGLSWWLGLTRIRRSDLMTIIFTSGSTGVPKGVMLSHGNIASNVQAIDQAAGFGYHDSMVGILPFFHSFGYTATLWAGTSCDMRGVYHFSPLDPKQVGKLVERYQGTILVATPTFLRTYMKRCTVDEFRSLEMIVAGAERLPNELCESFEQKFGVRPVEGYGTTELSPITAVNIPPSRQRGNFQIDAKQGTVGRTVAYVACKVTDLDSGRELGPNQSGMLWITGPNVMLGYLGREDLTSEVLVDGWYKTGDVAQIDEDGFIKITGRISRFSKIGGEMVPHLKIEEILTSLCDATPGDSAGDQANIAVTAIPDDKKGERLIVLHTAIRPTVDELRIGLSAAGLPNIFIPSPDSFRQVDQLPLLGSGKLDLKALKQLALDLFVCQNADGSSQAPIAQSKSL